jgi:deoxyribodipyrimidine photo-lyase
MKTGIVWFRQDLRLADNPALNAAVETCDNVIPVFIDETSGNSGLLQAESEASHVWLQHSLRQLDARLREKSSCLIILQGDALACLQKLCTETQATHIFWNRRYDPVGIQVDTDIKQQLKADYIINSFQANVLLEPWQLLKKDDTPYRVFTPFWKAAVKLGVVSSPLPEPVSIPTDVKPLSSLSFDDLGYTPTIPWDKPMMAYWQVGEDAAHEKLDHFLAEHGEVYKTDRDFPALPATSKLSPHLHFGEISPRQIIYQTTAFLADNPQAETSLRHFMSEVGWREFAYHLLYHYPETVNAPLDQRFKDFPWRENTKHELERWQRGYTGFPIIDAGMRELWHTGWMHNRVRMIVASLLTKNMLIPWQAGEQWFRNTLLDADLASNVLGWQWVAGSGADAAPYFRIFNPLLQSQKFDKDGEYIRRWVPELKDRDNKKIHLPLELGEKAGDYPKAIVDLKATRERALERFQQIKEYQR